MITPYPAKDKWESRKTDNKTVRVILLNGLSHNRFPEIKREERREY